jgi:hypothetical protein
MNGLSWSVRSSARYKTQNLQQAGSFSWHARTHGANNWPLRGASSSLATLWRDMIANDMTPEQAADNWDLPLAAIQEAIQYCEIHQDLLRLEAEEEQYRLQEQGVSFEPSAVA